MKNSNGLSRTVVGFLAGALLATGAVAVWPTPASTVGAAPRQEDPFGEERSGAAPLVWAECRPDQVRALVLGSLHLHQAGAEIDVLDSRRQGELSEVVSTLARFAPDRIAVEYPHPNQTALDSEYRAFVDAGLPGLAGLDPRNEIVQIGFALGKRLGHERVFAVDVPLTLWHDSIAIFDERYPESRDGLRARWPARYPRGSEPSPGEATLGEMLGFLNRDLRPGNSDMYGGFLPLVEDEVYAGALKLRPWYDRNLRMVQNLFRALEPGDRRILFVVGAGHVRILKQILELTPQLCPTDPGTYLPEG